MKRTIMFNEKIGRYDVPSFLFTENELLEIFFHLEHRTFGKYIAILTCGNRKQVYSLDNDMKVIVSPEFIKRGNYQPLSILLELRDPKADKVLIHSDPAFGGYHIEPLRIVKADGNITAISWCQELETRIEEFGERIKRVEDKLKEFEDKGTPLTFEE